MRFYRNKRDSQNCYAIIINVLKLLSKSVEKPTIKNLINESNSYPSTKFLKSILNELDVKTSTFKSGSLEDKSGTLSWIALLKNSIKNVGYYVIVLKIENGLVTYFHPGRGVIEDVISVFENIWTGFGIEFENDLSKEPRPKKTFRDSILRVLPIAVVMSFSSVLLLESTFVFLLGLLKVLGIYISSILVKMENDKSSFFRNGLCQINFSIGGRKADCFNSSEAKPNHVFSLADSSGIYFIFGALTLIVNHRFVLTDTIQVLVLFNYVSLLVCIVALGYQFFVIRKLCVFCLLIQLIVLMEFMLFEFGMNFSFAEMGLDVILFNPILFGFVFSSALWFYSKIGWKNESEKTVLKRKINLIKEDTQLFFTSLKERPRLVENAEVFKIPFGKKESDYKLTLITDPNCEKCRTVHEEFISMVKALESNVTFDVLLFTKNNTNMTLINKSINGNLDIDSFDSVFLKRNSIDFDSSKESSLQKILETNMKYLKESGIQNTPTFLCNGHQIPDFYSLKDISKYILEIQGRKQSLK